MDAKAVVDVVAACIITCFADIKRGGRSIGCLFLQKATRRNIIPRMKVLRSGHVCMHIRQEDMYETVPPKVHGNNPKVDSMRRIQGGKEGKLSQTSSTLGLEGRNSFVGL